MEEKIMVGDYVEPITEEFYDINLNELSITHEDLYGFVIDKNENLITIQGIGNDVETTWDEKRFRISEVPELFLTEEQRKRIRK